MTVYTIAPCPKPRMTQSDKWKKRPPVLKYRAFAEKCRLSNMRLSDSVSVVFTLSMPKSWSQKKRELMLGKPHTQKPDIDNLVKALLDANFKEDSQIHTIQAHKRWGVSGTIEIIREAKPWYI